MTHEEELQEAITLIRSGGKHLAVPILRDIIKTDRDNENAWLWLSTCMAKYEDKLYCLNQALRINPNNATTRTALARLNQAPALEDIQALTPTNNTPTFIPAQRQNKGSGIGVLTAILIVLIIVGGLTAYYLEYGPCGTRSVEEALQQITPITNRWDSAYNLTINGPLDMYTSNLQQLQTIRGDAKSVNVPYCMETAKSELIAGMDDFINSLVVTKDILNHNSANDSAALVQQGNDHFKAYKSEMERIKSCAPLCEFQTK
jgi:hypothetical protein